MDFYANIPPDVEAEGKEHKMKVDKEWRGQDPLPGQLYKGQGIFEQYKIEDNEITGQPDTVDYPFQKGIRLSKQIYHHPEQ